MWELVSGSGKRNIVHVEWAWSIYHSRAGGGKAFMKGAKTMGIYRIFYTGGSIDLGADNFNITQDGRVMFIRDKENIACYMLANITGFVKVG